MRNTTEPEFSPKEIQVLQCAADDMRAKEIATELGTTEQVVKNIRKEIMAKTSSHTFDHSVATALRRGLID